MEWDCANLSAEECEAFFSKMDEDLDYAFALSLQEDFKEEPTSKGCEQKSSSNSASLGIVDKQWEVLDPNPDIHALFLQFNAQFFYGKLEGVEVKWSPRMTLCAGVCSYEGRGGLCSVRLSLPLLKLRPRRDLVETLLHEMIHAYLFVTANYKDHNAHGPEFLKHMNRINKETGTKISVYHSFHDEVDLYRKHWWKCNGPCQKKRPFFGLVKRASNRAPGPRDFWFADHKSSCGGTFIKIKEPEDYQKKGEKRKPLKDNGNQLSNIKKFLKNPPSSSVSKNSNPVGKQMEHLFGKDNIANLNDSSKFDSLSTEVKNVTPFAGRGFALGSSSNAAPKTFLANIRRELVPPSSKTFTQTVHNNTTTSNKPSCIFGGEKPTSFKTDNKSFPSSSHPIQSVSINKSKKSSYVQSSIERFVTSPARPSTGSSVVDTSLNCDSNNPTKVECPVCFQLFPHSEINAHLDSCLL